MARADWSRVGSDLRLKITSETLAKYPAVDFFPLPEQETIVGHPAVQSRSNNEIVFRIPLESAPKNLSSMAGLVVFAQQPNGDDRAAWQITTAPAVSASRPAPAHGIFMFLLFGFLGGLILNLMPCVLPVISLKIFGFVQQAGQSRQKIFRSGIAFTIGIFAWFIALAVLLIVLKGAGRDVTWGGFQFTNPYFVLALSVIVLVFALNLFGVFEVSLPQSVTRNLLSTSERKDLLGSFFQGVFATVLATPCTAPFLGTALGFAFTQSAAIILAMFIAIAAGMSAPYLLLSAQPAWLRFLPRPGPWMVHVKQFMGFLLLATLLFLLYVLGAQRGLEGAIWASCFLLVISVACWMKGAFVLPTAPAVKRIVVLALMLLLVIGSGVYFIGENFQSAKIASQIRRSEVTGSRSRPNGCKPNWSKAGLSLSISPPHGVLRANSMKPACLKLRMCEKRSAPRDCESESRLDQRRSSDYKIIAAVRPPGGSTLRALPREKRRADCFSGSAHQRHGLGNSKPSRAESPRNKFGHGLSRAPWDMRRESSRFTLKFFRPRRLFYS